MSVTVDDRQLAVEQLGLTTVGQVLSHVARENRLVVNMLIDGQEPDLEQLPAVRAVPLCGRTVYVETADPAEMALEVLDDVASHLSEADSLRADAAEALSLGQQSKAMQKLNACFGIWQHAQESVIKVTQLLRLDLSVITCDSTPVSEMIAAFLEQLRGIKSALEARDFVALSDVLTYEMSETGSRWSDAISSLRDAVTQA